MSTSVTSQAALSSSQQLNDSLYWALRPRRLSIARSGESSAALDDQNITISCRVCNSFYFLFFFAIMATTDGAAVALAPCDEARLCGFAPHVKRQTICKGTAAAEALNVCASCVQNPLEKDFP